MAAASAGLLEGFGNPKRGFFRIDFVLFVLRRAQGLRPFGAGGDEPRSDLAGTATGRRLRLSAFKMSKNEVLKGA